jgi:peptidoglycan hydrolase-like protein with peptidoglycan-binding domain
MSKGSSYWGGSLSGLGEGELTDRNIAGVTKYNTRSAQNNNWGVSEYAKRAGVTSPGNVSIAALAAAFQRKYGLTVDGKIGPSTLQKIFSVKNSLNYTPTGENAEHIVLFIEPRATGLNPPSPYGGGGGGGGGDGGRAPAPTPRRSMSDGDEMNLHLCQSYLACSEAYKLMATHKQYIVPTSGKPIRGLI